MEYTEHPVEKIYAPAFGYGYDPDKPPQAQKPPQDGTQAKDHTFAEGMPYPKNDPFLILIAALILLAALIAGTLIAARYETRFLTRHDAPAYSARTEHHADLL